FILVNPFLSTPIVVTLHGSDIQSYKRKEGLIQKITKQVVKRATRVIVINDDMEKILYRSRGKLVKIPFGINTRMFNIQRSNENDSFLIGFPSDKNRPVKNYELFSEIICSLRKKGYSIDTLEFVNLS